MTENQVDLTDNEVLAFAQSIKSNFGFDFTEYAISSLKRRLVRILVLNQLKNSDELLAKLKNDNSFLGWFVEEVTVNTTELFRDHDFWIAFKNVVLPLLSEKMKINVWHAGCSTGEELISAAITFKEAGIHHRVNFLATDINPKVLQTAQSATYPIRHLESFKSNYTKAENKYKLDFYMKQTENGIEFNRDLLSQVEFKRFDLVKDEPQGEFDIIFCRNVMIYFNRELRDKVCCKFHKVLKPNGVFILGNKESMVWCSKSGDFITLNNENKIFKLKASAKEEI